MPLQQIIPTWFALNACDDISPSGLNDNRTKAPLFAGGLNIGDYFDLTEDEAAAHSFTDTGTLHAGRYRRVKVDDNATPANVAVGRIGFMVPLLNPELNVVTSANLGVANVRPVVFLNTITPGNYGFVQELGVANCYMAAAGGAIGATVGVTAATGVIVAAGTPAIGQLLEAGAANTTVKVLLNLPVLQG